MPLPFRDVLFAKIEAARGRKKDTPRPSADDTLKRVEDTSARIALAAHEAEAVVRLALTRGILAVCALIAWLIGFHGHGAVWALPPFVATLVSVILALVVLSRRMDPRIVGIIGAVCDGIVLSSLPWLFEAGERGAPPAFALKNDEVLFALVFVALNVYPMRPRYPLIVSILPAMVYLLFGLERLSRGDVPTAADWVLVRTTAAVNPAGYFINHVAFLLACGGAMAFVARSGRQIVARAAELDRRTAALTRYFSPDVAARIGELGPLNEAGVERTIAVLFLDLQGFTSLSESLSPRRVLSLLNSVHEGMVAAVFSERGTLDKFLGDGLMATFGALGDNDDMAGRASRAAQRMRAHLRVVNKQRADQGEVPLRIRIGIHLGPALVGSVGGAQRLEFTAIGDTVNTAARVEAACKDFATDVLITETVAEGLAPAATRMRGQVALRGKSRALTLYELIDVA